ncbi:hypothetical protein [Microbulbifer epialgicus]|uniref:Uncharacterized protein n=1 Tax=Microbulbifer epialgicus TaxID=393907 RepID=A0ABV4P141_9GAMM
MPNIQTATPQQELTLPSIKLPVNSNIVSLTPMQVDGFPSAICAAQDGSIWVSRLALNPANMKWSRIELPTDEPKEKEPETLRDLLEGFLPKPYRWIAKDFNGYWFAYLEVPRWLPRHGRWHGRSSFVRLNSDSVERLPEILKRRLSRTSLISLDRKLIDLNTLTESTPKPAPVKKTLREILGAHLFVGQKYIAKDDCDNWHKYKDLPTYRAKTGQWQGDWDFLCDDDEDAVVAKLPQSLRDKAPKDSLVSLDSEWEV